MFPPDAEVVEHLGRSCNSLKFGVGDRQRNVLVPTDDIFVLLSIVHTTTRSSSKVKYKIKVECTIRGSCQSEAHTISNCIRKRTKERYDRQAYNERPKKDKKDKKERKKEKPLKPIKMNTTNTRKERLEQLHTKAEAASVVHLSWILGIIKRKTLSHISFHPFSSSMVSVQAVL